MHRFIMRNARCWHSRNLRDNWHCRSSNSWLTWSHWCSRRWASVVRSLIINVIIMILQRLCSKIPIRHATHLAHQSGHIWVIHNHAGHGVNHHCQRVQQRRLLLGPGTLACPGQTQGRHEKDKWCQRRLQGKRDRNPERQMTAAMSSTKHMQSISKKTPKKKPFF